MVGECKTFRFTDFYAWQAPAKVVTDEDRAEAEQFKQKGNELMKEQKFEEAITCYTKAIEIDNRNAVYYCNRFVNNFCVI